MKEEQARPPRKKLLLGLVGLIVGLMVVFWLLARGPALSWLLKFAETTTQGRLQVRGASGPLYGPIYIEQLTYRDKGTRVSVNHIRLEWQINLARRHIAINKLHIAHIDFFSEPTDEEPPKLPSSLNLPFSFDIQEVKIVKAALNISGKTYEVNNAFCNLIYDRDTYQLQTLTAKTSFGNLDAKATLKDERPFIINSDISLHGIAHETRYNSSNKLSGSLQELAIDSALNAGDAFAKLQVIAMPFAENKLKHAYIDAQNINPAKWNQAWPSANINVALTTRNSSPNTLVGHFQADNRLPGPIDKQKLPLKSISSDFDGNTSNMIFSKIVLDLSQAGIFSGTGKLQNGALNATFTTQNFNLQGINSTLKPLRLAGTIAVASDNKNQSVQATLRDKRYLIALDASRDKNEVLIRNARIMAGKSEVQTNGKLSLGQQKSFTAQGSIKQFNPSDWGNYPSALVNANFVANGIYDKPWWTNFKFNFYDSKWRGQALTGGGSGEISLNHVRKVDINLSLADNRLTAQGAFGKPGERLYWNINIPNAGAIASGFNGRVNAQGNLAGSLREPILVFNANAAKLKLPGARQLGALQGQGTIELTPKGKMDADVTIQNYRQTELIINRAKMTIRGSRERHRANASISSAKFDLNTALEGSWHPEQGWSGTVLTLSNRGRYPLELLAPVKVAIASERLTIGNAKLKLAGGYFNINELSRNGANLRSSGTARNFPTEFLQTLLAKPLPFQSSLVVSGNWSLATNGQELSGELGIWRESGDITVNAQEQKIRLGLSTARIDVRAARNNVSANLNLIGTAFGNVNASVRTSLSAGPAWVIPSDAPLIARAKLDMPSLGWAAPLLGRTINLDGKLNMNVAANGTMRQPNLSGILNADNLKLTLPDQGINLQAGTMRARFSQDKIVLERAAFSGARGGKLTATGNAAYVANKPTLQLNIVASDFPALARPDRQAIVDGTINAALQRDLMTVDGKVKVNYAYIEIKKDKGPVISQDVIVLGRPEKKQSSRGLPFRTQMALQINLGEKFYVKGEGLDARLVGEFTVRGSDRGTPTAQGNVRVAQGTYSAYGQKLTIEKGILQFVGPIDNPGLDILAMRKNMEVEAGVAVTGTVRNPRVTLVSEPPVPDNEKLSWLVLGHGLNSNSKADFNLLQSAAGALFSKGQSTSLQGRIARATGLDEVALGGSSLQDSMLKLGKQLSSKVYVSFEKGLSGAEDLVKINYILSRRWTVQAQTGSDNGVDLLYSLSFD